MITAIKIRRFLDRILKRDHSVVGNGPHELLVVFQDKIFSISFNEDNGVWKVYKNTINLRDETSLDEIYIKNNSSVNQADQDYILSLIKRRYPRIKIELS